MGVINRKGDLLSYSGYIVHQCNCVTNRPLGLSAQIFRKFPEANIYSDGTQRKPGQIIVRGRVVALLAQKTPGKPKATEPREEWFLCCLNELKTFMEQNDITEIAFPYGIGCGLAGGNWDKYYQMIEEFAKDTTVYLYQL